MSSKKIFATGLTITSSDDLEGVGTIRQVDSKWYKWVKYNEGSGPVAAAANNAVYYHGADGYDDGEVTSDISDAVAIGAGVLQAAPADGEFCWIQIKGSATLNTSLTAGADGDAITANGAGDGTFTAADALGEFVIGAAIDASADKVLLDCPW